MPARADRLPAALLLLCAALALVVLSAGPAQAHAALLTSAPFDGEALGTAPDEVTLEFDEPVDVPAGAVRVHDATGAVLATTAAQPDGAPTRVVVSLPDELADGGYVVTYRIVSADGHPVDGALVFTVGGADDVPAQVLTALLSGSTDAVAGAAATVVRWAGYVAALLCAGAVVFGARVSAAGQDAGARRTARRAAAGALVATVVGLPAQAALVAGRPAAAVDPVALAEVAGSSLGAGALLRATALVVLLLLLRDRAGAATSTARPTAAGAAALLAAGAVLWSFLLDGHTVTTEPRALVLAADAVHLVAGAVWFGGLVCLVAALREQRDHDRPVAAAALVARFSLLATVAVAGVVVAGLALTWAEVRAPRALVTTSYGWALLAKLALAGVALALGAHANRRLVPAVTARLAPASAAQPVPAGGSSDLPLPPAADGTGAPLAAGTDGAWAALRRTVRAEVAVLVAVLLATAVLVNLQPAAQAAGITGAYSTYVELGDDMQLNLVVDPNRVGRNEVHLYVLDATGRPSRDARDARLALTLPEQDLGPIERDGTTAGPGHWVVVGDELAVPGRWVVEVTVGVSRFEERSAEVPVTVNP